MTPGLFHMLFPHESARPEACLCAGTPRSGLATAQGCTAAAGPVATTVDLARGAGHPFQKERWTVVML